MVFLFVSCSPSFSLCNGYGSVEKQVLALADLLSSAFASTFKDEVTKDVESETILIETLLTKQQTELEDLVKENLQLVKGLQGVSTGNSAFLTLNLFGKIKVLSGVCRSTEADEVLGAQRAAEEEAGG